MGKKDKKVINYAAPGATVGVQAGSVTIGGIRLGPGGVEVDGLVVDDEDED